MRVKLHLEGRQLRLRQLPFELGRAQFALAVFPVKIEYVKDAQDGGVRDEAVEAAGEDEGGDAGEKVRDLFDREGAEHQKAGDAKCR